MNILTSLIRDVIGGVRFVIYIILTVLIVSSEIILGVHLPHNSFVIGAFAVHTIAVFFLGMKVEHNVVANREQIFDEATGNEAKT